MNRTGWTKHVLELNPALKAEQEQYEHNAVMRQARQVEEQMRLTGVEPEPQRETDLQAALVARCRNHGLTVWSTPNGANLLSGEWRLVKWAKTAESLNQFVVTPGPREASPLLAPMLRKLHKGMTADKHGQINKLKNEGMLEGVPDLFLPYPRWREGFDLEDMLIDLNCNEIKMNEVADEIEKAQLHGLFLETKLPGGKPDPEQEKMIDWLNANGYRAEVYTELEQGWEIVCEHCGLAK